MNENTKLIEINGVKLEVDMRFARRVETLAVGSRVKVLVKTDYSENFSVHPGVLVGFEPFESLPTLVVAYLEIDYSGAKLKFLYYNAKTKNTEVIAAESSSEGLELSRDETLAKMDRDIEQKIAAVEDAKRQRTYFLAQFGRYFTPTEPKIEPELGAI